MLEALLAINRPMFVWLCWLGLTGCVAGIYAYILFVWRPYARQLRRERGEPTRMVILEVETTLRRAADAGDIEAKRRLSVMRRLAQAAGAFAAMATVVGISMC